MNNSEDTPDRQRATSEPKPTDTSELAQRIRKAQEARQAGNGGRVSRQGDMSTLARGLRIGTEFVAAILVGTGIGYVIDEVAGTRPWAMLVMFLLGFAAGILNVTRVVAELNEKNAARESDADTMD